MITYLRTLFFIVIPVITTYAQIPTNTWRDHLPYHNAHKVVVAGNKIYCATESALFYLNKTDNSLNKLSRINGLSDLGVGSIAFDEKSKTLIIGYDNGNIDLINNDIIYNLPDLKNKNLLTDKGIRNINIYTDYAYLSCGFGVVVINIAKREVSDTWLIGDKGSYLGVNFIGIVGDSIYALTDNGILISNANSAFHNYYGSWILDTTLQNYNGKFYSGTILNGELFVINNSANLYKLTNDYKWQKLFDAWNVNSLSSSADKLYLNTNNLVSILNSSGSLIETIDIKNATYTTTDANGNIYTASSTDGLVFYDNAKYTAHYPNGPISNRTFRIANNGTQIVAVFGGYNEGTGVNSWAGIEFYSLNDDMQLWKNYTSTEYDTLKYGSDASIVGATGYEGNYYIGTWGTGIIEVKNDKVIKRIYEETTNNVFTTNKTTYCGVSGMDFDKNGNLWVVQRNLEAPFFVKTPDGKWYNYRYDNILSKTLTGPILVSANNDIWAIPIYGGLIGVINAGSNPATKSDDNWLEFAFYDEEGNIISTEVKCIAEDKEGAIWIGSNNGIGVYDNPSEILQNKNENKKPRSRVPVQEVDGYLHKLLEGEVVKSIVVDGANRKWIGTAGGGLFLLSPDGTEQILNLNKSNSLLFSNNIYSMAMNPRNGELFIGTDAGLQSYMTSASEANKTFTNVYAFPNPVQPGYSGLITVRGLMFDTSVKITDISGNLVYEGISNGGDFVWNGKDMAGNDIMSGLYVVMCANNDGSEYEATKILIVK